MSHAFRLYAHRGASAELPENTLPAFRRALEIPGVDALELDVHLTRDGHALVSHDEHASRMGGVDAHWRDLDLALPPIESTDEVGALTGAFHHMRDSLEEYIRNLEATTKAKERLESELEIARKIQMDMLPPGRAGGGYLRRTLRQIKDTPWRSRPRLPTSQASQEVSMPLLRRWPISRPTASFMATKQ